MLTIVGPVDVPEHEAARTLSDLLIRAWPRIATSQEDQVYIIVAAKCHGQQVRDIDILLLADLNPGLSYSPFLSVSDRDGQPANPPSIEIRSLCVIVEVKDHAAQGVHFTGTDVIVAYGREWKNATDQVERQKNSLINYFRHLGISKAPIITPLLWLRNVSNTELPRRPHNIMGAEITGDLLLNVIGQNARLTGRKGQETIDPFAGNPRNLKLLAEIFTKEVQPTHLDRLRMERINQRSGELASLTQIVGRKLLVLRGRGGTGKSMRLLQLAKYLLDEDDARVLILTYNRALVADIRRLLTIMNVGDSLAERAIQIQTVHSFIYSAVRTLGITSEQENDDFLTNYEPLKNEALAYLTSGTISQADIRQMASTGEGAFAWDYVFVDEGQDWPTNERDLLLQMYPPQKVAVAYGREQLVRGQIAASWREAGTPSHTEIITLKTAFRMKANLARFVSSVAKHLGVQNAVWESNQELLGGQVVVIDGPYLYNRDLHDQWVAQNRADANAPVDMLFCIPPTLVMQDQASGERQSVAARVFSQWGYKVWDGATDKMRDTYPTELEQLRIVQYESCRGLEGWIVVNLALDRLYDLKLQEGSNYAAKTEESPGVFSQDPLQAPSWAAQWVLIPLTRAMDTLVIQLDGGPSALRVALKAAAEEHADIVKWITTRQTTAGRA